MLLLALGFAGKSLPDVKSDWEGGNDWYRVYVEVGDATYGEGTFTVATGPSHPWGTCQNILFGGFSSCGDAWTSYFTLRDYSAQVEYVSSMWNVTGAGPINPTPGWSLDSMHQYCTGTQSITGGFLTSWSLPNGLLVKQYLVAGGTEYSNAYVRHTVVVVNQGGSQAQIGLRVVWDIQVAFEDGAYFRPAGDPSWHSVEIAYDNPDFDYYIFSEGTPGVDTILGSVKNVSFGGYAATPPEHLSYSNWRNLFYDSTWADCTSDGESIGSDDSAIGYWYGYSSPILVAPGDSVSFTQFIFTTIQPLEAYEAEEGARVAAGPGYLVLPAGASAYDPSGRLVARGEGKHLLSPGIYMVRLNGGRLTRVMVR